MPLKASVIYLVEKYHFETMTLNYFADMAWAPANGMQFKGSKRFHEIQSPINLGNAKQKSGKEILGDLITHAKEATP